MATVEGVAVEVNEEQAADLARLEAMAGNGGAEQAEAEQEQAAGLGAVESLAAMFTIAGMVAGSIGYVRTAEIWQPETCRGLSEKVVPVLQKHAWGLKVLDMLETGAGVEEMALFVYAAPLAFATWKAASLDTEAMRPKKPEPKPEPVQAVEPDSTQEAWAT